MSVVLSMSMSADGFIAGPDDGPAHRFGVGAVIAGRRTLDIASRWNGDHHDGLPVFVLTRSEPAEPLTATPWCWTCATASGR